MAKVATITADFRAEAAQFLSELKKVNDSAKTTASSIKRDLGGALQVVAGLVSVGAFAAFVKSAADAADQMAKTADRLGITTERLQALRLAAQGAGVGVEVLDKALETSQRRLAEAAATGSGDTVDWIRRLNLNIDELRRQSPDQLFGTYAEAISKLQNVGDRFAATQALMGKGTESLINLLKGGRAPLAQAAQDIRDLGIELTRVDAAQIEHANDSLQRLKAVSQGVGQIIATAVSPYVQSFAERIINAGKEADGLREKIETFVKASYVGLGIITNAWNVLDLAVSNVAGGLANIGHSVLSVAKSFIDASKAADEFFGLGDAHKAVADKLSAGLSFLEGLSDESDERIAAAINGIKSFAQLGAEADKIVADARAKAETAAAGATGTGTLGIGPSDAAIKEAEKLQKALSDAYAETNKELQKQIQQSSEDRFAFLQEDLNREVQLYQEAADERVAMERIANDTITANRQQAQDTAVAILQTLGQRSKALALAALVVQKAIAIQQILVASRIAAELAFASQLIPGDPTSLPRAYAAKAAVLASGYLNAGLTAALGVVQAANIFSAGGNSPGSATNPISTTSTGAVSAAGAQQGRVITVNLNGPIAGPDASRWLIDQLRGLINDTDTIIIGGNSQQAAVIRGS